MGIDFSLSKVRDQEFGDGLRLPGPGPARVTRLQFHDFKSVEDLAGLGVVVVDPGFLLPGSTAGEYSIEEGGDF